MQSTVRALRRLRAPRLSVQRLLQTLRVVPVAWPFIRLGPNGDGGYVLPDCLEGMSRCLSAGVDDSWGFELDLFHRFGVSSTLCDGDKQRPPDLPEFFGFDQVWLSTKTKQDSTALSDWVHQYKESEQRNDFILQMDIEGSEYSVLRSTHRKVLRNFRIIIVEFHAFDHVILLPDFLFKFRPVFKKLLRDFAVVHLHANNCCGSINFSGETIPRVLEVTFLRRDWLRPLQDSKGAREPLKKMNLDFDCVPKNLSIELGPDWPAFNDRRQS